MNRCMVVEIDGWGECGLTPASVTSIAVTSNVATLSPSPGMTAGRVYRFESAFTTPIGTGLFTATGTATLAVVAPDVGSTVVVATIVLEDHYRLCTSVPSWGPTNPDAAGWYPVIDSPGQDVPRSVTSRGGVWSAGGMEIGCVNGGAFVDAVSAAEFARLFASTFETVETAAGDPSVGDDAPITFGQVFIQTAGGGAGTHTGATQINDESVCIESWTGSQANVRRGVLGTMPQNHPPFSGLFAGLATPIGRTCRVYVYDEDAVSREDYTSVFHGVLTDVGGVTEGADFTITIDGETVTTFAQALANRAPNTARLITLGSATVGNPYSAVIEIVQQTDVLFWQWIKFGPIAFRLSVSPAPQPADINSADGLWTVWQSIVTDVYQENPVFLEDVPDNGEHRALQGMALAFLYGEQAGDDPGLDAIVGDDFASYILRTGIGGGPYVENIDGSIFARFNLREGSKFRQKYQECELCHVFAPYDYTFSTTPLTQQRPGGFVRINPVEALLQLLVSTGTGQNNVVFAESWMPAYQDLIPGVFGLGIPAARIDTASFARMFAQLEPLRLFNLYITQSDTGEVAEWIDKHILQPLFLALVTDSQGNLVLVDVATADRSDGLPTLDETDLYVLDGEPLRATWRLASDEIASGVRYQFKSPWLAHDENPATFATDLVVRGTQSTLNGSANLFGRMAPAMIAIEPPTSFDPGNPTLLQRRASQWLQSYARPFAVVECVVSDSYAPDIGDTVLVSLTAYRGPTGARPMVSQRGLIVSRADDRIQGVADLEIWMLGGATERVWTASGRIESVASDTEFDLGTTYTTPYVIGLYTTDAASFEVGMQVRLYDQYFTDRATNTPEIVAITGDTIEIDVAFDNGGTVTPAPGDILLPAAYTDNTGTTAATVQAWMTSAITSAGKSAWE